MVKKFLVLIAILFCISSCDVLKKASTTASQSTKQQVAQQQTSPKAEPSKVYQASATRVNDIIHTKLDVRFDWQKQYLYGKATIRVKPYFYPVSTLVLDAREMEIKEVALVDSASNKTPLAYTYSNNLITIQLNKYYKNNEEYTVYISYVAKPEELKQVGGSHAITEDKGLYFINPLGADADKPQQIWTQGETESNSVWFPTIDRPNERMTHEIFMTVDKKYATLSNGELAFSIDNGDNTRTDCWKMNQPHAPYLVMMAVGEFAIVKDKWREKEVSYYVEKEYEPYARAIFGNTPAMLEYYSNKLGVEYPWNKYAQAVVRDYVSGAMENTTAAIFGEFVQRTDRELLDRNFEHVVAHELFHEWFGDLVTCESWSNIPLNESFATYGEYLWEEYKYGRDAADYHSEKSRKGYFSESENKQVPMIRFYYKDREEVFDAHSYNKGGQILHMLRTYVGDDAFFAALKLYLETNKYNTVEIHQLRLAFEQVTGEDLNWFFNQWFLSSGHPVLEFSSKYDAVRKKQQVTIKQLQDTLKTPLYKLPMQIDIYTGNGKQQHKIIVSKAVETFEFDAQDVKLVNVDAQKSLLCQKTEFKTVNEWVYQYRNAPLYLDRKEAIEGLLKTPQDTLAQSAIIAALNDKMWSVRTFVISQLAGIASGNEKEIKKQLVALYSSDTVAAVRAAAINYLSKQYTDKDLLSLYQYALNDKSYAVIGAAMFAMVKNDTQKGLEVVKQYENDKSKDVLLHIAKIYAQYGADSQNEFYINNLNRLRGYAKSSFVWNYATFLKRINNADTLKSALDALKQAAEKDKKDARVADVLAEVIADLEKRIPAAEKK